MYKIARIAVDGSNIHFDKLYSYLVPEELCRQTNAGSIVLVPFGNTAKPRAGIVLETDSAESAPEGVKSILDCAPEEAVLSEELRSIVYYLRDHTFCTYYDAVKAVLPYGALYHIQQKDGRYSLKKGVSRPAERLCSLNESALSDARLNPKQQAVVEILRTGPLRFSVLRKNCLSLSSLHTLIKKNIIVETDEDKTLDFYDEVEFDEQLPELSTEQQNAFTELLPYIGDSLPHSAYLYGVTGSGKTLVFMHLVREALRQNKSVLILVPEIGLTPQMIRRLKAAFGKRVAVQHSALSHTERFMQWRSIERGEKNIVVGTRSAVFAPLQHIGLIIMDEEHEHTYHSESSPRFSAHEIARKRAKDHGALLLLASATPSVERFWRAEQGMIPPVILKSRFSGNPLPEVTIADMRREIEEGNASELSSLLVSSLQSTLNAGKQAILLLNRRGYQTSVRCPDCGEIIKCPYCSVAMVYHKKRNMLMCHYCGKVIFPTPQRCDKCGSKLVYSGYGTQKIEEKLAELFPNARVLRMDQDSTGKRNSHEQMLRDFAQHKYDLLLGTQMVAKGLDFEDVNLVGVIGIDAMLMGQSFHSYESAFSMITQVVGRCGRSGEPGRAVIQSADPENPVLLLGAAQDYDTFYKQEIAFRKLALYPPFCSICTVVFTGKKENRVLQAAAGFEKIIEAETKKLNARIPLRVLGPAPMNIMMMNEQYRYRLTIKCRDDASFRNMLRNALDEYNSKHLNGMATISVDMNAEDD